MFSETNKKAPPVKTERGLLGGWVKNSCYGISSNLSVPIA
jgi:hypothetical protein